MAEILGLPVAFDVEEGVLDAGVRLLVFERGAVVALHGRQDGQLPVRLDLLFGTPDLLRQKQAAGGVQGGRVQVAERQFHCTEMQFHFHLPLRVAEVQGQQQGGAVRSPTAHREAETAKAHRG